VRKSFIFLSIFSIASISFAQKTNKEGSAYKFEKIHSVDKTTIKDQCRTGTCWSYSTLSMLESELIRKGKGDIDLSEMYIARMAYIDKAITYVRMNGKHQFDQGGEGHDIPYIIAKYGIVPESVYTGLVNGQTRHNHSELMSVLKPVVDAIASKNPGTIGTEWIDAVNGILDAYLGKVPESFEYNGKSYTPKSFANSLELDMDDYVVLTSFTHHPYYTSFALEIPDNWSMQTAINVPLNILTSTVNNSLEKGISVAWATDVSEKGFAYRDGLAIWVADSLITKKGKDDKHFNNAGAEKQGSVFYNPTKELEVTVGERQAQFNSQRTTDDHGMHIVGLYKEANGTPFYHVKNSWGDSNEMGGYLFASENYFKMKTISIMVHKDGLTKDLRKKLDLD